jgi:FMN reductase
VSTEQPTASERPVERLVLVYGTASPPGRLHRGVHQMATAVTEQFPGVATTVVDCSAHALEPCDGRALDDYSATTQAVVATVRDADAVVFASPVYRASFTGVLKNLLDLLPAEALLHKPVGIVAMGGSDHHYLAVESHLRDVLAWFGALVVPTGVYLKGSDFAEGALNDVRLAELAALAASVVQLARAARATDLGPLPLSARYG